MNITNMTVADDDFFVEYFAKHLGTAKPDASAFTPFDGGTLDHQEQYLLDSDISLEAFNAVGIRRPSVAEDVDYSRDVLMDMLNEEHLDASWNRRTFLDQFAELENRSINVRDKSPVLDASSIGDLIDIVFCEKSRFINSWSIRSGESGGASYED